MARERTVKMSDEEVESLKTARERIFGTDTVPLGQVVDTLCGDSDVSEEPPEQGPQPSAEVTNMVIGHYHENDDGRIRGVYPEGLDPSDFVGMVRRFVGKNIQYIQVVGNLDGHAVYRMINEKNNYTLHSMPWDAFIEKTARVNPDAPGTPDDDPARTVVRTDFDTMRQRRNEKVETGCTCLPDNVEACEKCGGKSESEDYSAIPCGCGDFEVRAPSGVVVPSIDVVCPECGNHFGHGE